MTLNIPPEQAIEILKKRKREIYITSFEPNVWVGKTKNDLLEIFGILDGKKFQISQIRFTTPVSSMKYEILEKGKKQADQFLESYIEQIEEYSKIEKKKLEESEEYFKIENSKLVSDYNKLLNDAKLIEIEKNQFLKNVESQNQKIQSLEKNTVQLTDITIKKIVMLISHLPISEVITFISIFLAIIGFSFWIGTTVQENLNKNEQFNSNKIISTQSDSIKDLKIVLKSTVLEKQNIKKQLDSIKRINK
ncbi:hypothetical protein IY39_10530 [Flavobacterium psychrophilum]|uniref:Uncharacterized protein n=4 Tax=Flavobacterium psychrophilum TaxID=96345 RepID=A6H1I9_FLAPJ|nr:hypothetical protein [Flavobacterium psychrophilum]AIJ37090.1 hypothetical protein FPSM_00595 [Flavobacterium psychrophilum]AIN72759.1 hypothetical protein FPG101_02835 [Flavobacterium psychrophilum FPG101]AIT66319.1 hypothetical protein IB65_10820 [Flavobacterium psychrophilum]AKC20144.1 hypothetical protein IY36_10800 [Flavobacterium psychrophilum]AKC22517.1 hypothetical protein IY37_10815 [Flavobacterium psychrophilum]